MRRNLRHLLIWLAPALALIGCAAPPPFDGTIWSHPEGAPPGLRHATFRSAAMRTEIGYDLFLPATYDAEPQRRWPVIYFLHGKFGDEHTEARRFAAFLEEGASPQAIVVFPNGGRASKYIDAAPRSRMDGVMMIETAIARELVDHVDAAYRTLAQRESRFIQGFSMGGMGALRLAFAHPDRFASVFAFAPAVDDTAENIAEEEPQLLAESLGGDPRAWEARMAKTLAVRQADAIRGRLPIGISVGEIDELMPSIQDLTATLRAQDLAFSFATVPEFGHDYRFGANFGFVGVARR